MKWNPYLANDHKPTVNNQCNTKEKALTKNASYS